MSTKQQIERRLSRVEDQIDALTVAVVVGNDIAAETRDGLAPFVRQREVEDAIEDAIERQVVVGFHYTALDEERSVRIVSPYESRLTKTGLHLVGYDHVRDGVRQFNLKRIENLAPIPAYPYEAPEGR